MALWCLVTGQPATSWLVLTELQREVFFTEAEKVIRARAKASEGR